ncbi:MAG: DUF1549 domain-containing protein, partial [Planctomycetales bacterium]|nr:DUF1549 domain-containing protein [Planctomycetales bacterium]
MRSAPLNDDFANQRCKSVVSLILGLVVSVLGMAGSVSVGFSQESVTGAGQDSARRLEAFEKQIRPFLVNECYECHGAEVQEAGLRVDFRQALLDGGDSGPAIMPGEPDKSLLYLSITHEHPDLRMPEGRPQLPASVLANFRQWIADGAVDPRDEPGEPESVAGHWDQVFEARLAANPMLHPVEFRSPPAPLDRTWSQRPADAFVLDQLEQRGLPAAAPANDSQWLRRVHLATTGLPPSPDEVRRWLADPSDRHRTQIVERLLASPAFGERWARHWMDLVRYAESYGHEQDFEVPFAWRYRDYLIRAFNADVAYDQFVSEHLAGDLLPSPRRNDVEGFNESVLATGFWYMHQATHAPVDPVQDEADRIDNQIDV